MKSLLLSLFMIGSFFSAAQDSKELDKRNGFKSIKLGYPIDSVKGHIFQKELREKDEFTVKLYSVQNEELKKIGDVAVQAIQLLTYQDLIYKIFVTTPEFLGFFCNE